MKEPDGDRERTVRDGQKERDREKEREKRRGRRIGNESIQRELERVVVVYRRLFPSRRWKASKMRRIPPCNSKQGDPHSDVKTFAVISLRDCEERNKKISDTIPPPCTSFFTVATIPRSYNSSLYQILRTIRDTRPMKSVVKLRECRNRKKIYRSWKKKEKKRLRQRKKLPEESVQ